jgi:glycoprotein endo-alpha-1,2-mannosidase
LGARHLCGAVLGSVVVCALLIAASSRAAGGETPGRVGAVAVFYYPWYSTPTRDGSWAHWYVERDGNAVLSTAYYPSRGLYSSSNPRVVAAQMRDIAGAGIDTVVVSWWGSESPEASRLPLVAEAARRVGLAVAIHLEPYRGRSPASAAADIARLHEEGGFKDFYVYDADRDPADEWAAALEPLTGVRVFGQTTLVGRAKAAGFDGIYTYDVVTWRGAMFKRLCTQAHASGLLCAPSVGPGYDARLATSDLSVADRRRGATYDKMWRSAFRSGSDLVTITSYNEWQEGTQIEPARSQVGRASYEGAWGKSGIDAQRAYLTATSTWAAKLRVRLRQ